MGVELGDAVDKEGGCISRRASCSASRSHGFQASQLSALDAYASVHPAAAYCIAAATNEGSGMPYARAPPIPTNPKTVKREGTA
jgi:hypothetical protein